MHQRAKAFQRLRRAQLPWPLMHSLSVGQRQSVKKGAARTSGLPSTASGPRPPFSASSRSSTRPATRAAGAPSLSTTPTSAPFLSTSSSARGRSLAESCGSGRGIWFHATWWPRGAHFSSALSVAET